MSRGLFSKPGKVFASAFASPVLVLTVFFSAILAAKGEFKPFVVPEILVESFNLGVLLGLIASLYLTGIIVFKKLLQLDQVAQS